MSMETPQKDPARDDVALLFEVGLDRFLNPGTLDREHRLRRAYASSWETVQGVLLAESAHWREREDPFEKLLGLFSQICDLEDKPEISKQLHLAYMGLYNETTDHMVHAILFENASEGTYAVDLIREEIRQIASEASLKIPEADVAQYTMYHVASLHLMRIAGGERAIPNRFEIEMDYMDYLFENQREA